MDEVTDFAGYLSKLTGEFTDDERGWFVDSFSRHMKHCSDPGAFVVNIDDVVLWLGFGQKAKAVRLLTDNFEEDVDFATAFPDGKADFELAFPLGKASHGGHNSHSDSKIPNLL